MKLRRLLLASFVCLIALGAAAIYLLIEKNEPHPKTALSEKATDHSVSPSDSLEERHLELAQLAFESIPPFTFKAASIALNRKPSIPVLTDPSYLLTNHSLPQSTDFEIPVNFHPEAALLVANRVFNADDFLFHVEYVPRRFHPGYIFKITLTPKQEISCRALAKNTTFLIDRCRANVKGNYSWHKKAVLEALSLLKEGDHFNIILFDDRLKRLSENSLAVTPENLAYASDFLEKETFRLFLSTDLYTSLEKIIPDEVESEAIHIAILLSDGESYLSLEKQRQLISKWCKKNQGKLSLFCLTSQRGSHLTLLDTLTSFNKGSLLYLPKNEDSSERLTQLITSLEFPIGKNIHSSGITQDEEMHVYLQPKNCRLSDLYKNRPFVVYGSTNRLSDFVLCLQGDHGNQQFDIVKRISFENALFGTLSLERKWAEWVAQDYYEKFFEDGKTCHLEAVKNLLSPLNITPSFLP